MNRHFSDLLLSVQDTPDFRERYEREVKVMFEKTVTPRQKIIRGAAAVLCFALSAASAYGFVWTAGQPGAPRWAFALMALLFLVVGIGQLLLARRDKEDVRSQVSMQIGGIGGLLLGPALALLLGSLQEPRGTASAYMLAAAVVLLFVSAMIQVGGAIRVSELNMKEEMLGIRLKLAEMAEKMELST